mmetsp:Transcript_44440/g.117961  ORF Transcript_44440/g.117961 Transcript_44440/m.117961 type:complete len:541 (-) Transcript_44440:228-1850(-)
MMKVKGWGLHGALVKEEKDEVLEEKDELVSSDAGPDPGVAEVAAPEPDEPKKKKLKRTFLNCEALCERLQTALQGNGKHGENLKSELNEVMQTILRRPSTKADLNYVVDLGPPAMLTLRIPVYEIELSSEFIPDAKGEGTRKEIEKSLASQAIEHFLLRLQLGELTLRDSPMPPAPGDPTGRGAEHHVFPTLQPGLQEAAIDWLTLSCPAPIMPLASRDEIASPNFHSNDDSKSNLNTALQKLLGRPTTKADRIFVISPDLGAATLDLPSLDPPLQVSCDIGPDDCTKPGQFDKVSKKNIEQKLATAALEQLIEEEVLSFDPAATSAAASYKPGPQAVSLATARGDKRSFKQLEAWKCGQGVDILEDFICRPVDQNNPTLWTATLTIPMCAGTGFKELQGVGCSGKKNDARDLAADDLLVKIANVPVRDLMVIPDTLSTVNRKRSWKEAMEKETNGGTWYPTATSSAPALKTQYILPVSRAVTVPRLGRPRVSSPASLQAISWEPSRVMIPPRRPWALPGAVIGQSWKGKGHKGGFGRLC